MIVHPTTGHPAAIGPPGRPAQDARHYGGRGELLVSERGREADVERPRPDPHEQCDGEVAQLVQEHEQSEAEDHDEPGQWLPLTACARAGRTARAQSLLRRNSVTKNSKTLRTSRKIAAASSGALSLSPPLRRRWKSTITFVASLHEATSAATASAYSVGHQLLTTVWNIALAAVLVAVAFGRSGGKRLVEESSTRARELRAAPPA